MPVLVLDDDHRVADLDLGVGDGATRPGDPHPLGRAEHVGVEVQGLCCALYDETGLTRRYVSGIGLGLAPVVILFLLVVGYFTGKTIGRPADPTTARRNLPDRLPRAHSRADAGEGGSRRLVAGVLSAETLSRT